GQRAAAPSLLPSTRPFALGRSRRRRRGRPSLPPSSTSAQSREFPGSSAGMKLIIEDEEGQRRVVPVVSDEITIGREDGNTIRLPERNVSRRHARLVRDNGFFVIEDLGSSNGVRINGDRIDAPRRVQEGDLIQIGDYDLGIEGKIEPVSAPPQVEEAKPPAPVRLAGATAPAAASGAGGSTAIIRVSDLARSAPRATRRELSKGERPRLVGLSQTVRGQEFPLER